MMDFVADFVSDADRAVLHAHGLADFDALWAWQGDTVDTPNTGRGGVSSVCRLQLGDACYYLKRQHGHLTRSLRAPFGEPTFAREWRNVQRYQRLGIDTLDVAFFGVKAGDKKAGKQTRAILLTRALTGFDDLDSFLARWQRLPETTRRHIVHACATFAQRLHAAGVKHGCLYPKHLFLREASDGWQVRVIDLEKSRRLLPGRRDRIADIEPLIRRASVWNDADVRAFLTAYLGEKRDVEPWLARLAARRRAKQHR